MDCEISLHSATGSIYIAVSNSSLLSKWKWCSTRASKSCSNTRNSKQHFWINFGL